MGGTHDVREEPRKQKTRSCRTQELAEAVAQENERQEKGALRKLEASRQRDQRHVKIETVTGNEWNRCVPKSLAFWRAYCPSRM